MLPSFSHSRFFPHKDLGYEYEIVLEKSHQEDLQKSWVTFDHQEVSW